MKYLSSLALWISLTVVPVSATVLVNDTWQDGTRSDPTPANGYAENNGVTGTDADADGDLESAWFKGGSGALAPVGPGGPLRGSGFAGSSASWTTYFTAESTPVTLTGTGDQLKLTWTFTPDGVNAANSSQNFRIALVDCPSGARISSDTSPGSAAYTGYGIFINFGQTFNHSHPFQLMARNAGSAALLSSSGAWSALADGAANGTHGFDSGTTYSLVMTMTRNAAGGLDIVATMAGGNLNNSGTASASWTDAPPNGGSYSFDTFSLRPSDTNTTAAIFDTSLFKVEFIPGATAPVIDIDPQDRAALVGQDATFSVLASGTSPLSYQWFHNTDSPVAQATHSMLTLTNVQLADAGDYFVVVTNNYGSVTSAVAQLTVTTPVAPSISVQPQDQTLLPGASAGFSVVAAGSEPLNYQWYFNTNTAISNGTESVLVLTNVQVDAAGTYSVIVSNIAGSVGSAYAVLTVNTNPMAPVFVSQPASQVVLAGGTATFTALAAGTAPIAYQWNHNGLPVDGAASSTLVLTNVQSANTGSYTLVASNSVGTATSDPATLAVSPELPIVNSAYNLTGFGRATTGGGIIAETDPAYRKVTNALDLANAILAANKVAGSVKVIEIMNDLDLGWNEVGTAVQTLGSTPFRPHATPKLHPRLLVTGVSLIDIKSKSGLTIFSANGAAIRHACFNIKSTANIIVRNLKFDELWEWDESSKGDYDGNDWDFIDLGNAGTVSNVWIDHCTFTKAYDGITDIKGGSFNITFSWCKYTGDDGATNTNSWVRQQINYLEQSPSSYPMYNFLRTHGFSVEDIVTIIQGHDKTHLIGANSLSSENAQHTVTFHHDWFINPWDRLPRLRAGNVHNYNLYVDDTVGLAAKRLRDARAAAMSAADRNTLNNTYSFNPFLNGTISTESGAILVEKSVYIDCLTPLRNNQTDPSDPTYTGKILALDTIYQMDATVIRGNSTDPGNPLGPFQAANIPFSWNLPGNQLPYSYDMDDPGQLQSIVTSPTAGAGAGVLAWAKTNWLRTTYAATAPVIVADPQDQTVPVGQTATFLVVAGGSAPLRYQWYFNTNTPLAGATNAALILTHVQATNAGVYSVTVTNVAGQATSAGATLALPAVNSPPTAESYAAATAQNTPVSIPVARLLSLTSDTDGDILSITAVSPTSTNNGSVVLNDMAAVYSPPQDYVGADLFSYIVTDTHSASSTGSVFMTIISLNDVVPAVAGTPSSSNGVFRSSFVGSANLTYSIDRATNLAGPWELNYTNVVAGTNGFFQLTDPNSPPAPQRFYRGRYP